MRTSLVLPWLVLFSSLPACSTASSTADAGATDAGATDSGPGDGGPVLDSGDSSTTPDADTGADASPCTDTPVGRLCVRGAVAGGTGSEELTAGGKVLFQVFPKGCHSSSCTVVREASCAVRSASASAITLTGKFCLAPTGAPGCTPDCSGGGFARCEQAGVAAGQYTARLDALEVTFQVPSTLPAGGACVGSP